MLWLGSKAVCVIPKVTLSLLLVLQKADEPGRGARVQMRLEACASYPGWRTLALAQCSATHSIGDPG